MEPGENLSNMAPAAAESQKHSLLRSLPHIEDGISQLAVRHEGVSEHLVLLPPCPRDSRYETQNLRLKIGLSKVEARRATAFGEDLRMQASAVPSLRRNCSPRPNDSGHCAAHKPETQIV